MSWQAYVDDSLIGTKAVDQAAIYGIQGGKWAGSAGFEISNAEFAEIQKAYEDKSEPKAIQQSGFHIAGSKYITLRADDRSIYGKLGKTGICIVKSKQAIIIAHYPENVQAGNSANVVEKLVDYLISVNF